MTIQIAGAGSLMERFRVTNMSWREAIELHDLEPDLLYVASEIAAIAGRQHIVFVSGAVLHELVTDPRTKARAFPDHPNAYLAMAFTDDVIITASGHFDERGRDATTVVGRNNIWKVTLGTRRGDPRAYGGAATHQGVTLSFAGEADYPLPAGEDDLTETGIADLLALLPSLYTDLGK